MHDGATDMALISLTLQGDAQAYARLVQRYEAFVFTIALRYIKSREDAEEIAQDVFVKAYRSLADFKGTSKFSTWLYTIATTTSITALRKKKMVVQSLDGMAEQAVQMKGELQAHGIEQKSRAALLNQALRLVSPDDAHVLTLFYKGEQTLEEIAKIFGKEVNAVKVQLHRARIRLKEQMQTHFRAEVDHIL